MKEQGVTELSEDEDDVFIILPNDPNEIVGGKYDLDGRQLSRWDMLSDAFSRPLDSPDAISAAFNAYQSGRHQEAGLRGLLHFFDPAAGHLDEAEVDVFFADILPKMATLCLELPSLIEAKLRLLNADQTQSVRLSQRQVACLMANAFMSAFSLGNTGNINMDQLFKLLDPTSGGRSHKAQALVGEKLKCLINYYRIVVERFAESTSVHGTQIEFRRLKVQPSESSDVWAHFHKSWTLCDDPLSEVTISSTGSIEDDGRDMLQIDFANCRIGGGVLSHGAVQEEIRFLISPELIVSKLLAPDPMGDDEVIFMSGTERFANYTGYGRTFAFAGRHVDNTPVVSGRLQSQVVAMDAINFVGRQAKQYSRAYIDRELLKARLAFIHEDAEKRPTTVATGNWGCGAFHGDVQLKFLIQLIAASVSSSGGRRLAYFTFGDTALQTTLADLHAKLVENNVTVAQLYRLIISYEKAIGQVKDLVSYVQDQMETWSALDNDWDDKVT